MGNPNGTPIWYELGATDPDAAARFYEAVVAWRIEAKPPGEMDYRMIAVPGGDNVGGLTAHDPAQVPTAAMTPGWRVYFGVDDVDATAAKITAAGGTVHLGPFDLEGVGRMAFAADPQGNVFYVMRGATEGATSTAWDRTGLGKCNWNELSTTDQEAGNAFYAAVFGWCYPDKMAMPGMGDYVFVEAVGETIGATMTAPPGAPTGWQFYFRTADIDEAAATVRAQGGTVMAGPMEVPGGDRIIVAADPAGTPVGFVGPGEGK